MSRIKVAAIQLVADASKAQNLDKVVRMIGEAVARYGPLDLIVLPEYCYGEPTAETVTQIAESIPGPFSETMQELARAHRVNLVAGSFAVSIPGRRFRAPRSLCRRS